MAFYAVLRDRDDGDYDCVAAFQKDDDSLECPAIEWAIQVIEHMRDPHEDEVFRVVEIDAVSDVIQSHTDFGGKRVELSHLNGDLTDKLKAAFLGMTFQQVVS